MVGEIVKTSLSGADIVIGTSDALTDFDCNNYVCQSLDVIGSVSSAVGLVLENIPATKPLTSITSSVTVGWRAVRLRYYCKNYGIFWDCTIAAGQRIKKAVKFTIKH